MDTPGAAARVSVSQTTRTSRSNRNLRFWILGTNEIILLHYIRAQLRLGFAAIDPSVLG